MCHLWRECVCQIITLRIRINEIKDELRDKRLFVDAVVVLLVVGVLLNRWYFHFKIYRIRFCYDFDQRRSNLSQVSQNWNISFFFLSFINLKNEISGNRLKSNAKCWFLFDFVNNKSKNSDHWLLNVKDNTTEHVIYLKRPKSFEGCHHKRCKSNFDLLELFFVCIYRLLLLQLMRNCRGVCLERLKRSITRSLRQRK